MHNGHRGQSQTRLQQPRRWIWAGIGLLGLVTFTPAHAANTFTVNSPGDGVDKNIGDGVCLTAAGTCTLRAAIQEANSLAGKDTINLDTSVTLSLTGANEDNAASGDLDVTDDLDIFGIKDGSGNYSATSTSIDGNGGVVKDRVFHVLAGADLAITGVTIKNGWVFNSTGGGILITSGATATLDKVYIQKNTAEGPVSGSATSGGGIANNGTLTMSGSQLQENAVVNGDSGGGGLYNTSVATLSNTDIDNNAVNSGPGSKGGGGGGGIANAGSGTQSGGGGVNALILKTCNITKNSAAEGAGIRNLFGNVIITGSTLSDNNATGSGGAIENTSGGLLISRSTLKDNYAGQGGGGISNFGILDVSQVLITGNTSAIGGGLYNGGVGAASLVNTTITGNLVNLGSGGGIHNARDLTATNVTIYNNRSPVGGNEVHFKYSTASGKPPTATFINSIIGNPTRTPVCGFEDSATNPFKSNGHNLETSNTCNFTDSTDIVNTDPLLVLDPTGLQSNGGASMTISLLAGSPAQNKGDNLVCPVIDQRSFARNDGQCDIGAYEISSTPFTQAAADMKVEFASDLRTAGAGYQLSYTVRVRNLGDDNADKVRVDITLPANVELVSPGSPAGGRCDPTSAGVQCLIGSVHAYESIEFYVLTVPKLTGVTLEASAEVHADTADPNPTNNKVKVNQDVALIPPTTSGNQGACGVSNLCNSGGGGGSLGWAELLLGLPAIRRLRRRLH